MAIAPPSTAKTRNSGEFFWGDDFTAKMGKASSFTQSFRMFDNLNSTGQYRINFDIGVATKISKWLSWQTTASIVILRIPRRAARQTIY